MQRRLKRGIDLVGSLLLLLLSLPAMLAAAILVRLSSPGPILYRWKIVGENGRPLTSYKFRTMYEDADERKAELLARNEMKGPVFKLTHDPRITPIGRHLRRFSLDELPQLWSVLKGDLSLVGPRPPLQSEYARFEAWQTRKLSVKPGLTCLWQVRGRNEIRDFDDWVRMDLDYIERWSIWLDLKILALTVPAVLTARGAR